MNEEQIRPRTLINEYIRLSRIDARTFFNGCERQCLPCVGCGNGSHLVNAFTKDGFAYDECHHCYTLFQNPRPPKRAFDHFYQESPSSEFWAKEFFPAVAESRRELLFLPKAKKIIDMCERRDLKLNSFMDVGAGYGILLEELKKLSPETEILAVEPGKELAQVCRAKGIDVLETVAEKAEGWADKADLVSSFEVIEHAHDPSAFVSALSSLARPGGYVLVTGLGVEGFDIQVLWEKSRSVMPPHHINFLSLRGFENILKKAGLEAVEVFTPGELDVNIVQNHYAESEDAKMPHRLLRTLYSRPDAVLKNFQAFLAQSALSSHVWAIGRKPLIAGAGA